MMQMFHLMEQNGVLLSIDMADGGDTQVGELEEVIQECPEVEGGHRAFWYGNPSSVEGTD